MGAWRTREPRRRRHQLGVGGKQRGFSILANPLPLGQEAQLTAGTVRPRGDTGMGYSLGSACDMPQAPSLEVSLPLQGF